MFESKKFESVKALSRILEILEKYWGYKSFRPLQEDIINSVLEGKDTLALMPTGGGKSITFQVPALVNDGICLVITPLIALMKDQVENLKQKGIRALAINSGLSRAEIDITLENAVFGNFKFLYISPERIETDIFLKRVERMNINLIAIDEAHCISQWGYDFRPSYLNIAQLRPLFPEIPILALTATATKDVVDDIQDKLNFKQKNLLQKSFKRDNLVYYVRKTEDKFKATTDVINWTKGSGIIYVRSRKKTQEISKTLQRQGIKADFYHAGLSSEDRTYKQDRWKENKIQVIVATNAFGMGIDKPDVRFVIHLDLPDTLEEYFQEAGRAGRDEKKAFAFLLYNNVDKANAERRISTNFPDIPTIKRVYTALCNYYKLAIGAGKGIVYDFNLIDFSTTYQFNKLIVYNSLKFIEKEGYLEVTDELQNPSKVHFLVNRDDLYKFQLKNSQFDSFIKLLLRSYTGLFSEYAIIDEEWLAKQAKTNRNVIYQYLLKLSNSKIINYIPQKKTPLVIFTEERLDEKNLVISKDNYEKRKERYVWRLRQMIHYANSEFECRNEILLQYFGEKDTKPCGECDVCRAKKEQTITDDEIKLVEEKLKLLLAEQDITTNQTIDKLGKDKKKTIRIIQWLIDNKKIEVDSNDCLVWKE